MTMDGSVPAGADEYGPALPAAHRVSEPPSYAVPPVSARSPRLGRTAMIMAISVAVFSMLASVLIGAFGTTIYDFSDIGSTGGRVGFNAQPNQLAFGVQMFLGTVFGTWALVQGIVAVASNRGRRFGIVAIVVAAAAPTLSVVLWIAIGIAAGHHIPA
jgi:hypothetical protein